jgi:DNA-binding CsgD family transcriptional regulator
MHGTFLSFPRRGDSVVFAGLEQAQNLAGKDIRRPISDPFSRCRVCGKLSQIVKAIRRKRIADVNSRRGAVGAPAATDVRRKIQRARCLPLILSNFAGGSKNSRSSDINILSDRELEIFSFIGRGISVSELATELHVSVKTIETHQMRMKEKLALHSAAELRQKAREWLAKSAVNRIREDPESE